MLVYFGCASPFTFGPEYVIHISVDGLNAGILQSLIDAGEAPNFKRFEVEGAWTLNGRTDFSHTDTLPNHTTMLTGRPVLRPADLPHAPFHNGTENSSPQKRATLHKDEYIPSVFDVVHDAGRSTALYASKDKFAIYDQSYDETNGVPSARGRDKIDKFLTADDGPPRYSQGLNERFVEEMGAQHYNYAFVHYRDPDSAGHATRWGSSAYRQAIHGVDEYLGAVFRLVESDPQFKGKTTIILTADHGGWALGHDDPEVAESYTIPIFVWRGGCSRRSVRDERSVADGPGQSARGLRNRQAADSQRRHGEPGLVAVGLGANTDFADRCRPRLARGDTGRLQLRRHGGRRG